MKICLKEDFTTHLLLLLAMSMEMYRMWHIASMVEMRENHSVVMFKELLMAGDVELNPGPFNSGRFKWLILNNYYTALNLYITPLRLQKNVNYEI